MKSFFKHTVILSMSLLGAASAAMATDWLTDIDIKRADLSPIKLVLMNDGKAAGRMEYSWAREGDAYVIKDLTQMEPNILETATGVIDVKSLQPRSIDIDFAMGSSQMLVDLDWSGDQVTGNFTVKQEGKDDRVTPTNAAITAPLRLSIFGLIASLPLKEGYEAALPWFNVMGNKVEDIRLIHVGTEVVETPAGTFDTHKVAIKDSTPENFVYVTKSLPQKIVRIDVVGQPMQFLLTE